MGEKPKISLRHLQIDKANTTMVVSIAAAAACAVFALIACTTLWKQAAYNRKVISAKEKTVKQVNKDIASIDQLKTSYEAFVSEKTNIIGGSKDGQGDKDGDNAKITLDAMPSVYDFPGTVSGFSKIVAGFNNKGIVGMDDELNQKNNSDPKNIVEVPLSVEVSGTVDATQQFLMTLKNSIRPVNIQTITFTGASTGDINTTISFKTYYQPKKKFEVKTEVVK